MDWSSTRVLVTGAAGFIGSELIEALVWRGAQVTVLARLDGEAARPAADPLPNGRPKALRTLKGDLGDPSTARSAVADQGFVFHLAHPADPLGTTAILEACRLEETPRLVCVTTAGLYGGAWAASHDEGVVQPAGPAATGAIGAAEIALGYFHAFGVPVSVARSFNTYGPGQCARALIPTVVAQVLREGRVRLGSAAPAHDLCYVGDMAEGVIRIAETEEAIGEIINLGAARETPIGELAAMVFRILGRTPSIEVDMPHGAAPEDAMRLIASFDKARHLLDWEPSVALEDGLARTIAWIVANPAAHTTGPA